MTYAIDPYVVLGIPSTASNQDIEAAFSKRKQALEPAVNAQKVGAVVQLEQLQAARSMLSDHTRRAEYDKQLAEKKRETSFYLRITTSKKVVERLPEPQVIYLLVEILPKVGTNTAPIKRDAGLNLTLVLDHSNSMSGIRLDRVKRAASEIIENLSENDVLSVVGFNDHAEVVIPATRVKDKRVLAMKTRIMRASGGTEMYKGLLAGVTENRKHLSQDRVNHVILLTDGNTYGDQDKCLNLAREVANEGISISALGLGSEWNDKFLDEIASTTGGSSGFIKSASTVVSFLNSQVQSLSNIFAERMQISIATPKDVDIEMVFKLAPSPQPLPEAEGLIQLGGMQFERPISVLVQLQIPAGVSTNVQSLARMVISGNLMTEQRIHSVVSDLSVQVDDNPPYEDPPNKILDALGKLTLYRMQERANEAIENGNVREATKRLQNLATRLIEVGQGDLGQEAMKEAKRLERTNMLSEEGRKTLKYQTRLLISEDSS